MPPEDGGGDEDPGPPTGGGAGGAGSCIAPDVPDLNFAPLLALDYGETFPFGAIPWIAEQFDQLDAEAVAPEVTLTPTVLGDEYEWTVSLEDFDPYMDVVRTIVAWLLWVGAVWTAARSFLGLEWGGNPAEAIEDVYE
jgi:hypothetical protein